MILQSITVIVRRHLTWDRLGMKFTTKDQDNDIDNSKSCAVTYKGAWWYKTCHRSNLNGKYLSGHHTTHADGVNWLSWRGYHYSLKITEMKLH